LAADLRDDIRSSFAWLATPDGTVPILDEYGSDDEDEEWEEEKEEEDFADCARWLQVVNSRWCAKWVVTKCI
jgi:hypothetical protein